MKDIIMGLLRDYFNTDMIIRDVTVTEHQGQRAVNIFPNLAANKWGLYEQGSVSVNGIGKPDLNKAEEVLEKRRLLKALQVFNITKRILRQRMVEKEWNMLYGGVVPESSEKDHTKMVDYSIGALFHTKVIVETEYEEMQGIVDENGILLGMKLLPKQPYDEFQGLVSEEKK